MIYGSTREPGATVIDTVVAVGGSESNLMNSDGMAPAVVIAEQANTGPGIGRGALHLSKLSLQSLSDYRHTCCLTSTLCKSNRVHDQSSANETWPCMLNMGYDGSYSVHLWPACGE